MFLYGGGSHNSVVVEFEDYIAVVEAPLYESRNLAVIDEIVAVSYTHLTLPTTPYV